MKIFAAAVAAAIAGGCAPATPKATPALTKPERDTAPVRSPADEANTFAYAEGLRAELFASEPLVEDPIWLTFDERGRLWVVELRGFMHDLTAAGEDQPIGRVKIVEDSDGDGRADRATVFLDGLVMPRTVTVVRGGALVVHDRKLWFAADADGDGRADGQTLVDASYIRTGNPEHQPNGLVRALDNWLYSANANVRHRRAADGSWRRETTELRGQWGLSQDDDGRLFYNYNYDLIRSDLVPPNAMTRNPHRPSSRGSNVPLTNDQRVWPIHATTGVNRGYFPGVLDDRGRLTTVTAACAPLVYREDLLGDAFRGSVFVLEPAGNLVQRVIVRADGIRLSGAHALEARATWASTDERFRPVHAAAGPDGALYVADMYRGVIQHGRYLSPYLRDQILARGLEQPVNLGRIWRLVPAAGAPARKPALATASTADLVATLSHPAGWWRDTAQRLLVERGARDAIPALVQLAIGPDGAPLGRVHALWTLEALAPSNGESLLPALDARDVRVRIAAMRVLEALATSAGSPRLRTAVADRLARAAVSDDARIELQRALTLGALTPGEQGERALLGIATRYASDPTTGPVFADAVVAGLAGRELPFLRRALATNAAGDALVKALASAIVREGDRGRIAELFALLEGRPEGMARALIGGVLENVADLEHAPPPLGREPRALAKLARSTDPALAAMALRTTSFFAWPGHAPPPRPRLVKLPATPEMEESLHAGRELFESICAPCHGVRGEGQEAMAPPLHASEWVTGPNHRLVRIALYGLDGPVHVRGETYEPPRVMPNMPGVEGLSEDQMAVLLTYVYDAFGPGGRGINPELVRRVRAKEMGRVRPFSEAELLAAEPIEAPVVKEEKR